MGPPMKRSLINTIIRESIEFLETQNFFLPPWAFWSAPEWKGKYETCAEIVNNKLGWDVTPFGSDDFYRRGLLAFAIRNGNAQNGKKPYAEKILIVEENQETPLHFHWSKMEDIINRCGGKLVFQLYGSTKDENLSESPITVQVDGITTQVEAGGQLVLSPGESICLEQGTYHRFFAKAGGGKVLAGEVSSVNDDSKDNRFVEDLGRFPGIVEDEEPKHLLVTDYKNYL